MHFIVSEYEENETEFEFLCDSVPVPISGDKLQTSLSQPTEIGRIFDSECPCNPNLLSNALRKSSREASQWKLIFIERKRIKVRCLLYSPCIIGFHVHALLLEG
jgi:hypothetical protein